MIDPAGRPEVQAYRACGTPVQPKLFTDRELGLTDPWADFFDDIRLRGWDTESAA